MAEAPAELQERQPMNGNPFLSLASRWQASLKWRIAYAYGALILVLGLVVAGMAYQSVDRVVRGQIDQRVSLMAGDLADVAAGFLSARPPLDLSPVVARQSRFDGVAYVFIEDRKGDVPVHSLKSFPLDLLEPLSSQQRRQTHHVTRKYQGKAVVETRAPILNGQLGTVHVGIWRDAVDAQAKRAALPVVGLIAAAVGAGLALVFLIAHRIMHPIRRLTQVAGKISTGEFETPLVAGSDDEIGEVARPLERMRASLKAAIRRIGRTQEKETQAAL